MIDWAHKEDFEKDSLHKEFVFTQYDYYHPEQPPTITITNAELVSESVELTQSLCTEDSIRFNALENSMLKFSVRNTLPNLTGMVFHADIKLESFIPGIYNTFRLGDFRVASDKASSNLETRDIVAYDLLYKFMTHTYKGWYNRLFEGGATVTLKDLRDAFFAFYVGNHPWISQESTTLINDDIVIKKSKKISKPTAREILSTICELNGVVGHLDRDNVFRYISVEDSSEEQEMDDSLTISAQSEDYNVAQIDRVEILSPSGDVLGWYGEEEDDAENTYTIENNFILKGLGDEASAQAAAYTMASRIYEKIHLFSFVPFDAEFKGNPCYEVGDRISFSIKTKIVHSIIMSRVMTGIQSLHDTYSAYGKETYSGDANVLSNMIKNISQQIGQESSSKNVMVEPLYTSGVPIAKITIDGVETILYAPEGGGGGGTGYRLSAHNSLQFLDYTEVT